VPRDRVSRLVHSAVSGVVDDGRRAGQSDELLDDDPESLDDDPESLDDEEPESLDDGPESDQPPSQPPPDQPWS